MDFFEYRKQRTTVTEIDLDMNYIIENVSPALRKEVIALIDAVEDDAELIKVKNALMSKAVGEEFQKVVESSILDEKELRFVEKLIIVSNAPVESKFELIKLLSGKGNKLKKSVFSKPFTKSISQLTPPKFRNNSCWMSISQDIINYSQQSANGVGKGELYFILVGEKGSKPSSRGSGAKGDVIIDGWNIEFKAGGIMHPGHRGGVKIGVTTELHKDLIEWGKKNGYDMRGAAAGYGSLHAVRGNKQNWLWQFFKELPKRDYDRLMKKYLTGVYGASMPAGKIAILVNKLRPILGDLEKVPKLFAPHVYAAYKKHEKFNSMMVINLKSGNCYNMVNSQKIPSGLKFKGPVLARGKSTYAVPEGGMSFGFD